MLFLEAKLLPTQKNITVPKGFPFTLGCTSQDPLELYHVIWMKEGIFVENDGHHDISSSNTLMIRQNYKLRNSAFCP